MKMTKDEMINKYLDGELNTAELDNFNDMLKFDEDLVTKLKAARTLENTIKNLEFEKAPAGINAKVLGRINEIKRSVAYSAKPLFAALSVFGVMIIGVFGFLLSHLDAGTGSEKTSALTEIKEFLTIDLSFINSIEFSQQNLTMIGLFFAFLLIVTAYFMVDTHKNVKNKIQHLQH